MKASRNHIWIAAAIAVAILLIATADNSSSRAAGSTAPSFSLKDANGNMHSAAEWQGRGAVVLLFISADCPISNRYAPTINQLAKIYGPRSTAFYGIHSDPDITPVAARQHANDYGFQFPMLLDPRQSLASRYGVSVTPTAVVVSASGDLLYRGRIDDRGVDLGKWRDTAGKQDLKDAMESVLAKRKVETPFHDAVGCFLPGMVVKK